METEMISESEFARIERVESTPSKQMTREEVREANNDYFKYLEKLIGKGWADKALKEYLDSIEEANNEVAVSKPGLEDIIVTRLK